MNSSDTSPDADEAIAETVELKDPLLAAFLAWLIPGLGHFYQGRTAKGVLFLVCILGTFLYGWEVGGRKVVYAAWNPPTVRRYAYFCQMWVGGAAMPALAQAAVTRNGGDPMWNNFMAPPERFLDKQDPRNDRTLAGWHRELNSDFEIGTVYTMIAGLLNLLAIFDAAAGPLPIARPKPPKDKG